MLTVYDHETFWADEIVGRYKIPIGSIPDVPIGKWINLYGSPQRTKGDHANLMNLFGEEMGIYIFMIIMLKKVQHIEEEYFIVPKNMEKLTQ